MLSWWSAVFRFALVGVLTWDTAFDIISKIIILSSMFWKLYHVTPAFVTSWLKRASSAKPVPCCEANVGVQNTSVVVWDARGWPVIEAKAAPHSIVCHCLGWKPDWLAAFIQSAATGPNVARYTISGLADLRAGIIAWNPATGSVKSG